MLTRKTAVAALLLVFGVIPGVHWARADLVIGGGFIPFPGIPFPPIPPRPEPEPPIPVSVHGQTPGDYNQDGEVDISDIIGLLDVLFVGSLPPLPCGDGGAGHPGNVALMDHQGDGEIDIGDAISMLRYRFLGGPPHVEGIQCLGIEGCPEACQL